MLDQVEQGRLGPLQVVQHDDERLRLGNGLEQLPERPRDDLGRLGLLGFAQQTEQRRRSDLVQS